jgi:hypothetical protein
MTKLSHSRVCQFNYILPIINFGFVIKFLHILMTPMLFLKYLVTWNNIEANIWEK